MTEKDTSLLPIETHFNEIHCIIELHRTRALRVVNNESLFICWNVGQYVSQKLKASEWGSKIVTQLSEYLRTKDPSLKGYSRRNIYNMILFFETYSSQHFLQLLSSIKTDNQFAQNGTAQDYSIVNRGNKIVQTNSAQFTATVNMSQILLAINWSMHTEILNKCKLIEQRLFYILYSKRKIKLS